MNRKNLTCAVLAGLAGVAGLAGTAQAVNLNPDGMGQVLVYPYYTANDGNQTLISVVNTTDHAKAVKVRFLEGFNSREVLDFNLYLSHHDVWVASIANGGASINGVGTPTLYVNDSSCTVPYFWGMKADSAEFAEQEFLPWAYRDNTDVGGQDLTDGGPTEMQRAAEGHFEMIEMGTLTGETAIDVTHVDSEPLDCAELSKKWTEVIGAADSGIWWEEANAAVSCVEGDDNNEELGQACTDMARASGGLFGGGAVINANNGTMYSYDAKAIQGFDKSVNGLHFEPGDILPSLASGSEEDAWVFFGVPQNTAVNLDYNNSVDAVSAVFMHEHLMNGYNSEVDADASTEWVITFPTKAFYADAFVMEYMGIEDTVEECTGEGEDETCVDVIVARNPFTQLFGATNSDGDPLCEIVSLRTWDREENTFTPTGPGDVIRPPTVSPSPPDQCVPGFDGECTPETVFQLCNEVNVLRFGDGVVFGTPDFGADGSLLLSVEDEFENGWGRINLAAYPTGVRTDDEGLVGLPATGFQAVEFENNYAEGGSVKAFYGGLYGHKGNVRRVND